MKKFITFITELNLPNKLTLLRIALVPLVVMSAVFIFVPSLLSSTSFMIMPSGAMAIGIAWYFYKKNKA